MIFHLIGKGKAVRTAAAAPGHPDPCAHQFSEASTPVVLKRRLLVEAAIVGTVADVHASPGLLHLVATLPATGSAAVDRIIRL